MTLRILNSKFAGEHPYSTDCYIHYIRKRITRSNEYACYGKIVVRVITSIGNAFLNFVSLLDQYFTLRQRNVNQRLNFLK